MNITIVLSSCGLLQRQRGLTSIQLTQIALGNGISVLDVRQDLDLISGFASRAQDVLVDVELVVDQRVSPFVDQVRIESVANEILVLTKQFRISIDAHLPAVSWLTA